MSLADIVKTAAPLLATALGGPLAGAVVSFVAGKMGVSDATQEKIQQVLAGSDPVRLRELEIGFQEFMAANGLRIDLAQLEVDRAEAASPSLLVAGWRPFVGWTCGLAFGYVAILEPVARFVARVAFGYAGEFPPIDTSLTMQVLLGMLGLAAARSWEKGRGVASS